MFLKKTLYLLDLYLGFVFFHHFLPLILERKVKVDDSTRGSFMSVKFTGFCGTTSYLFIIVLFIYIHIKKQYWLFCVACRACNSTFVSHTAVLLRGLSSAEASFIHLKLNSAVFICLKLLLRKKCKCPTSDNVPGK